MRHITTFIIWVLTSSIASLAIAQDSELVEPDIAFQLDSQVISSSKQEFTWTIRDDYYMYRDKFVFQPEDNTQILDIHYSPSKSKQDPTFGNVEIYEEQASITLTVKSETNNIRITAIGQGCNEPVGVCYPPIAKSLDLIIPAAHAQEPLAKALLPRSSALPGDSSDAVDELRSLLGDVGIQPEFLAEDEAFQLNVNADRSGESFSAEFTIANGYYLYQDKIKFNILSGNAQLREFDFPPGIPKHDENFGDVTVYTESFQTIIPIARRSPDSGSLKILAKYQGCAEKGICYPPTEKEFTLNLPGLVGTALANDHTQSRTDKAPSAEAQPSVDTGLLGYLIAAFGIGIALTFTPCVLPMIPILSSIIVGQGERASQMKGGILSILYVIGTSITYAIIGWVAGETGDQLQSYFQNIWALGTLSVIFVLMALSMFGLYSIQMPSFIQSRVQSKSANIGGGTASMVLILGIMSALVVGACVSPLLISLLSIAIVEGDPVLGASMMVSMSLGMGVFLIAIGFGAGFILPRAGAWMNRINYVFGVLLLAVAIYILSAIPSIPVLLLWAVLLIVTSVYLGATQSLPENAKGWQYFQKGMATILLLWGVLALIGGINGQRDILQPISLSALSNISNTNSGAQSDNNTHASLFTQIHTNEDLDEALDKAALSNKYLMLDFYADWCTDCIRMEKTTFADNAVMKIFDQQFLLVQVDLTDPKDENTKAIKKRLGVYGPPAMLFFKNGKDEIKDMRLYGYRNAQDFLKIIKQI